MQRGAPVKSPTGAALRSLLLPGWGQLYVEAYWKAPIFFLGNAVSAYLTIANHREYLRYQRRLEEAQARGEPWQTVALLRAYRATYVERRDVALAFWAAAYILAVVDAYVEAHLSSFQVDDRLSTQPMLAPAVMGVSLSLRW
ncbi:MAG: DUF5683 domain-containing protein [Bacteroidota bacterium]|nr:DUF5683 domain-containing protein [Bacteroidota bacterium]